MDNPYISLYRKYRPQTFEELAGEEHVTRTLANAIKQGRVSHAYLFAGPRGTGKTSTAKILAKAMNCEQGPTPTPDNTCDSCVEISAGSAVDVLEIDAASNRGIDEIRELRDKVHFAPARGRYKVYIIDEVHMLTTEAFNALLKMLEEPPAHAIFVLATTEPHKVISTILSRCQRFDFRRIGTSDIIRRLRHIATSEEIEIDEGALVLIASHAQGSLRDAISDIDQLVAYTGKKITMDDVSGALGLVPHEVLADFSELVATGDGAGALRTIAELVDSGQDLRQFVHGMLGHWRNIFVIKTTGAEDIIDVPAEHLARLRNQADKVSVATIDRSIALLSETYNEMRWSSDPRLALEVVAVKMAGLETGAPVAEAPVEAKPAARATEQPKTERKKAREAASGSKRAAKVEPETAKVEPEAAKVEPETAKVEPEAAPATPSEPEPAAAVAQSEPEQAAVAKTSEPEQPSQPPADVEDAGATLTAAKVVRVWPVIMEKVRKERIPTYSLLLECEPKARDNALVLVFNKRASFHKGEAEKPNNMKLVSAAAAEVFGTKVKIVCELGEKDRDSAPADAGPPDPQKPEEIHPHHTVRLMRDDFGAELVEENSTPD